MTEKFANKLRKPMHSLRAVEVMVDFECCYREDLQQVLRMITENPNRYKIISITQDGQGMYTVFFWRPVNG